MLLKVNVSKYVCIFIYFIWKLGRKKRVAVMTTLFFRKRRFSIRDYCTDIKYGVLDQCYIRGLSENGGKNG